MSRPAQPERHRNKRPDLPDLATMSELDAAALQELQERHREKQAQVQGGKSRGRPGVRGRAGHTRTMRRRGQLPHRETGVPLAECLTLLLFRLPSFRQLTGTQAKLVIWLVLVIEMEGGALVLGRGELAGKVGCRRRTVYKALPALKKAGLIRLEGTDRWRGRSSPTGASGPTRWKLGTRLKRFFARLTAVGTPIPGSTCTSTADVGSAPAPLGSSGSGRASRADFSGRLAAALKTLPIRGPDRWVLLALGKSCPVELWPIALAAAIHAASPAGGGLKMPATWVRQVCADVARAWGLELPSGWKVKPTPDGRMDRLRALFGDLVLGPETPAATAALPMRAGADRGRRGGQDAPGPAQDGAPAPSPAAKAPWDAQRAQLAQEHDTADAWRRRRGELLGEEEPW